MADVENYGLWVQCEVLPDGSYGVGIVVGEDRAFALTRKQAIKYAVACAAIATEADHNTAVWRVLTERVDMPEHLATATIQNELAGHRPDHSRVTHPLAFAIGMGRVRYPKPNAGQVKPVVVMRLDGKDVGQLTPGDLRGHALNVLTVLAVADLDASVHRFLVEIVDLDDERARAFVGSLAEYIPLDEGPRTL